MSNSPAELRRFYISLGIFPLTESCMNAFVTAIYQLLCVIISQPAINFESNYELTFQNRIHSLKIYASILIERD